MDMTETIAPRSDQLNADDLITGPVTVTVAEVVKGSPEQPVDVRLVEYPSRAYRPSKSMRRIMVAAWGAEAAAYAGRRITLVRNPEIMFGRDKVGGIEISHLSHLEKPLTVALTATRGKRKSFTVQPLKEAPQRWWNQDILACEGDETRLRSLYSEAVAEGAAETVLEAIKAAVAPTPEAVA